MFGMGPVELILVLFIALIIFGPGKIPEIGEAIGKGISKFKSAAKEAEETVNIKSDDKEEK
ncbi:Sec-independent protein translocase subunit TatA/TatB [Halothermothrix orenii]|uniref:Sec-independent protein translocase protein TatA n=1 Tax=Halothermothrix orenii (strain H 168 / OCM 544 / DSM 9562) TaxID=373903 RepID=B8D1R5_HALOH|nr:twin-arginine translocase TatA/TatE family subunit [Halothermothrix orenii]ACL69142.1 twin-arginine translocation protein, TatA subunit [Halothermothrix orenii H 168]